MRAGPSQPASAEEQNVRVPLAFERRRERRELRDRPERRVELPRVTQRADVDEAVVGGRGRLEQQLESTRSPEARRIELGERRHAAFRQRARAVEDVSLATLRVQPEEGGLLRID